jgi:hypothetical protein
MAHSTVSDTTFTADEENAVRNNMFPDQQITNKFSIIIPEQFLVLFTSGLFEAIRPIIILPENERSVVEQTLWDNPALVPVAIRNNPNFERISSEFSLLFDIFSVIFNLTTSQDIQNDREFGSVYTIGDVTMVGILQITRDQAFMLSGAEYIKTVEVIYPTEGY